MKRFLFLVIVLSFGLSLYAGEWRVLDDYRSYMSARELATKASNEGNTTVAYVQFLKAHDLAIKSATPRIACWQLNNLAKCLLNVYVKTKDARLLPKAKVLVEKAFTYEVEECYPTLNSIYDSISYHLDRVQRQYRTTKVEPTKTIKLKGK